ncbi:MAG: DNA-formamidopyrimidine glycosylase family protein, partial [Micrococcales bacterium]
MPELPEVETVRAGLAEYLTGAKVTSVEVLDARSLKRHQPGVQDFINVMTGAELKHMSRRGKFLWIPLDRE